MFCEQCGTPLQVDFNLCPKCGKTLGKVIGVAGEQPMVRPVAQSVVYSPSRLEQHVRTLGILWIVCGALFLIPALGLLVVGHVAPYVMHGEEIARTLGPLVLYLIGLSLFVVAAGGMCIGWGLMRREPWARGAAVVLGVLALFHPPFGTALGIYTLWVLLSDGAGAEYGRMAS
jgi:hypothetical protein